MGIKQEATDSKPFLKKTSDSVGLFIPKKELSWVVSLALISAFFVFMAGYFWGQRQAISQFLGKLEEESFSDKITYSLYTMNGKYLSDTEEDEVEEDQDAGEETPSDTIEKVEQSDQPTDESKKEEKATSTVTYVAPLVGFGTLHAANTFAHRVKDMGIDVHVKKRISRSPKGRAIAWYQVMTQTYSDKNEIEHIVMRIKDREKIKDVKIIEQKKG